MRTSGLEVEMYERFVDDSNLTPEVIELGSRYNHQTEWVEDDSNKDNDRRQHW